MNLYSNICPVAPSVVHRTSYNVEQFVCDSLLAALVLLQVQVAQQFVGIVRCRLHGHHACSMLTGIAVKQCRI